MGLLEKALKYKKNLNTEGKQTLIDKIAGPAETERNITKPDIINFKNIDLLDEYESTNQKNNDILHLSEEDITEVVLDDDNISKVEEEIVFLDDDSVVVNGENKISDHFDLAEDEFNFDEYDDYHVLYEIFKDLIKCETPEQLYDVISFSVMGQLAVSSVSVLIPDDSDYIKIAHSTGINVTEPVSWSKNRGIFSKIVLTREIVDLDNYKDDKDYREDYYRFISVDGRLISPIFSGNSINGALLLGEKIENGIYSKMDYIFIQNITQMFKIALEKISRFNDVSSKFEIQSDERGVFDDVEAIQDGLSGVRNKYDFLQYIRKSFSDLGVKVFSIFTYNTDFDIYEPELFEEDNVLGINREEIRISYDDHLVRLLQTRKTPVAIDNFTESEVLTEIYGKRRIEQMKHYIVYPFVFSGEIPGFIVINDIEENIHIDEIDIRMRKIVKFLFPYFNEFHIFENNKIKPGAINNGEYLYLEKKFNDCKKINAPFSMVKVFFTNTGIIKADNGSELVFKWLQVAEKAILNKLSANDAIYKSGMDRYILILPGKDKKYISNIAAVLKKEIQENTEFNLSYIAVTGGVDGNDIFDLMELLN